MLERFADSETEDIAITTADAADAILDWLKSGDIERVMTRVHSRYTEGS